MFDVDAGSPRSAGGSCDAGGHRDGGAGFAGVDPSELSDGELADALVASQREQAQLSWASARVMAEFDARRGWADDGSKSAAAWLARECRLPIAEARTLRRLGRRLATMPATAAALAAGDISAGHADRLASLNVPALRQAFAAAEAELVDYARTLPWPDFCRAVAYWCQLAAPDGVEADAADDEARRRVHLSPGLRGTGLLDAELTPVAMATVGGALDAIDRELYDADWAQLRAELGDAATADRLPRTPAQRRHDALVTMARRAMATPAGARPPRPLVNVLVGYETFAGRVCELADGTVLAPGQVAALLDEAVIERAVYDGPRRIVEVGERRLFTGALRRAIELRDRRCTHAGCDTPAARCEVDHVVPFAAGGTTTQANGTLRCPFHHRWRHRHDDPPVLTRR